MTNTQIVFNVDPKVKARALKRAKRERVSFESVLSFATQEFADGRFATVLEEKLNGKTVKELLLIHRDIKQRKNITAYKTSKAMDAHLRSL